LVGTPSQIEWLVVQNTGRLSLLSGTFKGLRLPPYS